MDDRTPQLRRVLQLHEWSDGDTLVTDDHYEATTGKRTARAIYRTSALPPGAPHPASRFLLAEHLPALLAVKPEITDAIVLTRDPAGNYTLSRWQSLTGDTAADLVGLTEARNPDRIPELVRQLWDL